MDPLDSQRHAVRTAHRADEATLLERVTDRWAPTTAERDRAVSRASEYAKTLRTHGRPDLMEAFLAEYGLSTKEGVALMCLAEALLRVPDAETMDALIEDKIAPSAWGQHLGRSSSSLVNASTWALLFTGKVLDDEPSSGPGALLRGAIKRLGEPVIRTAALQAMKVLGQQFVLGQNIGEALRRARGMEATLSISPHYFLGSSAMTASDAAAYYDSYREAILALGENAAASTVRDNPGISIKLSALHPRYDALQKDRVMTELVPRVSALAALARERNIGINIDAEEADRLDLSLDVIETVLAAPELLGWDGFGVVVQAYGKRASAVIDWLYALSEKVDQKLMVRLVKGAYWDTEIKHAQTEGVEDYPVFTRKEATDVSYLCCARQLLTYADRLYPQFATHNAHTVAAILEMAAPHHRYEFQRLHGMGESLHTLVHDREGTSCRIYAPVGVHRDLLAYLVRRLLENGANSSFVNQLLDEDVAIDEIVADPFERVRGHHRPALAALPRPQDIFRPQRINSAGWDLRHPLQSERVDHVRTAFVTTQWSATALIAGGRATGKERSVCNPADPTDRVGRVVEASLEDVNAALAAATPWDATAAERGAILQKAADLYEQNFGAIAVILTREAGKTLIDAELEVREAVDFLRYYALQGERYADQSPRGVFTCISPWNFPLAIFTGQIAAALAAGNGVLAKPAETTSIMGWYGATLLHEAGVPSTALQLLPGAGSIVGAALTSDSRVNGVCFTGSTAAAQRIHRAMADHLHPSAPLIAETGGLNAMIVDSTALLEQAVRDIVASAFQSAGQRCSALRMLYIQEEVADSLLEMVCGAMDELAVGRPWHVSTDVGPVIDEAAFENIHAYLTLQKGEGCILKQLDAPSVGYFVPPSVVRVTGIEEVEREVFGPVLHVATFKADEMDTVVDAINAKGFGLTFGMHSRIDDRVQAVTEKICVGNIYVNRNQIGAVVGSQPFGGEGLSGTGPKAGGPSYLPRFLAHPRTESAPVKGKPIALNDAQRLLSAAKRPDAEPIETLDLPGPMGESNRLSRIPRGIILCLGPTLDDAERQRMAAESMGCTAVVVVPGTRGLEALDGVLSVEALETLYGFDAVAFFAVEKEAHRARRALAARKGPIIPLLTEENMADLCVLERHLCVDTTAAGGTTALMAGHSSSYEAVSYEAVIP